MSDKIIEPKPKKNAGKKSGDIYKKDGKTEPTRNLEDAYLYDEREYTHVSKVQDKDDQASMREKWDAFFNRSNNSEYEV